MSSASSPAPFDPYEMLAIRAIGPMTSEGRMPLAEIARIAGSFQATLERLALSISGNSNIRGRRPRDIVEAVRLDFAGFRAGSAVLQMERRGQGTWPNDLFHETLDAFREGVLVMNKGASRAPQHFTPQVIKGLRDLTGGLSSQGLTQIEFTAGSATLCMVDQRFRRALRRVEQSAGSDEEAIIVGRLLMGDFSPASLRCRIDTFAGSVLCDFDADLRDAVLDSMDLLVKARGLAELQPDGSTIRLLHLEALEVVRETSMRTLATLARQQRVKPVEDIGVLLGEPIEDFEDFLDTVRSARRE